MPDKARSAALYALERCRRGGAWSAAVIDSAADKYSLDRRDTAFAARLTMCVLENSALCDHYIGAYCSMPAKKLEPAVLDILRAGVCQLIFMDKVPASAAVNTAVELCRENGYARAAGMVNAVLRRVAENKSALPEIPGVGTSEYLAVKYSHPKWLADRLIAEKGYDFAESFLAADNSPAPLYLQVNTLKTDAGELSGLIKESGCECRKHPWLDDCLVLENSGGVGQLPGFADGLFYIQDPAAAASVNFAGLLPGMDVLDACAAPGGKSFAAAIRMKNRGRILSCDIHDKKLGLISAGASRLGIDIIETAAHDARKPHEGLFDAVIADVPCSGIGVIRKKPEIRRKAESEISGLPAVQSAILDSLSGSVKAGGVLLYSTCTVLREENEDVIERFLAGHPDFVQDNFETWRGTANGMYTFWPQTDETDGFFVCRMKKHN